MPVTVQEMEAKSILREHKKVDSWFLSRYGMSLYRGCSHNCSYCDGRAETYYVDGVLGAESIHRIFDIIAGRQKVSKRIPLELFGDILDETDRVVVLLEQMDYLLKLKGEKSPYGYAAYSISRLPHSIAVQEDGLSKIKGVSGRTERVIREILDTGSCSEYRALMQATRANGTQIEKGPSIRASYSPRVLRRRKGCSKLGDGR